MLSIRMVWQLEWHASQHSADPETDDHPRQLLAKSARSRGAQYASPRHSPRGQCEPKNIKGRTLPRSWPISYIRAQMDWNTYQYLKRQQNSSNRKDIYSIVVLTTHAFPFLHT